MNAHDIEAFVSLYASNYDSQQPVRPARAFRGSEQVRVNWPAVFSGVADFHAELVAVATESQTGWSEWRWSGTHEDARRPRLARFVQSSSAGWASAAPVGASSVRLRARPE